MSKKRCRSIALPLQIQAVNCIMANLAEGVPQHLPPIAPAACHRTHSTTQPRSNIAVWSPDVFCYGFEHCRRSRNGKHCVSGQHPYVQDQHSTTNNSSILLY